MNTIIDDLYKMNKIFIDKGEIGSYPKYKSAMCNTLSYRSYALRWKVAHLRNKLVFIIF